MLFTLTLPLLRLCNYLPRWNSDLTVTEQTYALFSHSTARQNKGDKRRYYMEERTCCELLRIENLNIPLKKNILCPTIILAVTHTLKVACIFHPQNTSFMADWSRESLEVQGLQHKVKQMCSTLRSSSDIWAKSHWNKYCTTHWNTFLYWWNEVKQKQTESLNIIC